jgi:hypothetical protein
VLLESWRVGVRVTVEGGEEGFEPGERRPFFHLYRVG